jgi:release factor glutamine methyltransferase
LTPAAELLAAAARRLQAAGVESPRREARLLLAHALGARPEDFLAGGAMEPDEPARGRFEAALARRERREPLAYILGSREFWSLDFQVGRDVLIPRPESETLIEEALLRFPRRDAPLRVLDMGTGSGCLLLSFLSERPAASGVGLDISPAALNMAKRNATALGMDARTSFVLSDWASDIEGAFDVIFVNPPYIVRAELSGLVPEVVAYEPQLALDGGTDGLEAYRRASASLRPHLGPKGLAFLELGQGQAGAVAAILAESGLQVMGSVPDLAGIARCMVAGGTAQGPRSAAH